MFRSPGRHPKLVRGHRPKRVGVVAGVLAIAAGAPQLFARQEAAVSPNLAAIDVTRLEPGEDRPGGAATSRSNAIDNKAFSRVSGNLDSAGRFQFELGNAIFRKLWVSAPSSTKSSDGLGPLFNTRSCRRCHRRGGRGRPPAVGASKDNAVSIVLRLSISPQREAQKAALTSRRVNVIPEPTYGTQLQPSAIQGHAGEGRMQIAYRKIPVTLAGGKIVNLRKPVYRVTKLGYGPLDKNTMVSPRVAPQLIGLGLLDSVPAEQILEWADPHDSDGDGISGRANRVWSVEQNKVVLGKFGWKAGSPTVRQQSAEAFAGDIGISTPLIDAPSGDCTKRQTLCMNAPNGNTAKHGGVEVGDLLLDLVTFYAANLAVPPRRGADDKDILSGMAQFHKAGCAACHRPKYKTGDGSGHSHLSQQTIWPYSDLLLHDMGEGLADHRPEGVANGREWRTAPLWGLGLTKAVAGHELLLHDGRARGIEEAILWHGGEAKKARDFFAELPPLDRELLVKFVKSL